jgi:hypothetical protein
MGLPVGCRFSASGTGAALALRVDLHSTEPTLPTLVLGNGGEECVAGEIRPKARGDD